MKKILLNLATFIFFSTLAQATTQTVEVDFPRTQSVDVDKWLEETGASEIDFSSFPLDNLKTVLQGYDADHLQSITIMLKESGTWDKIRSANELYDALTKTFRNYPQDLFQNGISWLKDTNIWNPLIKYHDISELLLAIEKCPHSRRERILDWIKSNCYMKEIDENYPRLFFSKLLHKLGEYPDELYEKLTTWIVDNKALEKCENAYKLFNLLSYLEKWFKNPRFDEVFKLIVDKGIWNKCHSTYEVYLIYHGINTNFDTSVRFMNDHRMWDRFSTIEEVVNSLNQLKNLGEDFVAKGVTWLKETGAWDIKIDNDETIPTSAIYICVTLKIIQESDPDQSSVILAWLRDNRIIEKCRKGKTEPKIKNFNFLLRVLYESETEEKIKPILNWIQYSGALPHLDDEDSVIALVKASLLYEPEHLQGIDKWMKRSGAWDICISSQTLPSLTKCLHPWTIEALEDVTGWLKESGYWEQLNGNSLPTALGAFTNYPIDYIKKVESWLKKLNRWDNNLGVNLLKDMAILHQKLSNPAFLKNVEDLMAQYEQWNSQPFGKAVRDMLIDYMGLH